MEPKVINHWGKWINSEEPVTGVLSNNEIAWEFFDLNDEICLTCEEIADDIYSDDTLGLDEMENEIEFLECDSSHTKLYGDWVKEDDQYFPDKTGEFSALGSESTLQVVYSKYTARGNPCSPCYPGQVEFSNGGDFLAYTLPPELLYNE